MAKKFPIRPLHPERVCWGCDRYCSVDAMLCGNGTVPTPHPCELFGDDWMAWGLEAAQSEGPGETPCDVEAKEPASGALHSRS